MTLTPTEMEHRIGSVAESLRPIALESREFTGAAVSRLPQTHWRGRRIAAAIAAIAAILLIVVSTAVWRANNVERRGMSASSGDTPKTNGDETSMMTLDDGSRVEKQAGSEISVEHVTDGLRIRLKAGRIISRAPPGRRLAGTFTFKHERLRFLLSELCSS